MSFKHRFAAYKDLWRHYRAVFAHFWKERDSESMQTGLFNEQEAQFLPAALALQEKPASSTARITARVLMGMVAFLLLWSILGKMDIVVNATGKVVPSQRTKTIASVDVASVRVLHVVEGQKVKAGDVLVELDTSAQDAERDKAMGEAGVAALQVARSRAMIEAIDQLKAPRLPAVEGASADQLKAAQSHLDGQYRDFRAKLARIDDDIQKNKQALPLATQRAKDYLELSKERDVSTHAYMEKEQARIEVQGQLNQAITQRRALVDQTRKEAFDSLTEGSKVNAASAQDAKRASDHGKLLKLVAPVDGTVQQLTVHTVGGVVPAAQALMLIVPQEKHVEVEAFLENKDVGFVREGQTVKVKVDAFEYTKYGTISAKVTHVSRDAIADEKRGLIYSVKITLEKSTLGVGGKKEPITAGMSVNVDIKTGDRRIIEYVLSPLIQHQQESLRER